MSITRDTVHRIALADDAPPTLLPSKYRRDRAPFRVDRIVETLHDAETSEGNRTATYTVQAHGPVQTKAGKDHASQRESRTYVAADRYGDSTLSELPAELAVLLLGPDRLAAPLGADL